MAKQKLDSPEIASAPVDQGRFSASQRVRPKQPWVQPDAPDPPGNEARKLACGHAGFGTTTTSEQELAGPFVVRLQIIIDGLAAGDASGLCFWDLPGLDMNVCHRPTLT